MFGFDVAVLLQMIVPAVATAVVAAVKKVSPRVPKVFLPAIAPVVGVAVSLVTDSLSVADGAVLGALGVFVREVYDQAKKAFVSE
jgi:MFS superfamily sulfate permease-like transporter